MKDSNARRTNYQASKEKQIKRNDRAKGKQQMLPKVDKGLVKHSAPTTKDPQEGLPSTVKADTGKNLSTKEKVEL